MLTVHNMHWAVLYVCKLLMKNKAKKTIISLKTKKGQYIIYYNTTGFQYFLKLFYLIKQQQKRKAPLCFSGVTTTVVNNSVWLDT